MQLLFPLDSNTTFYLEEAGYTGEECPIREDTYIRVNTSFKHFAYSHSHIQFKLHPSYIPKVLTDTSLLDQIPLLVALGLSEKEIVEILRS